jgi:hypothetical protein
MAVSGPGSHSGGVYFVAFDAGASHHQASNEGYLRHTGGTFTAPNPFHVSLACLEFEESTAADVDVECAAGTGTMVVRQNGKAVCEAGTPGQPDFQLTCPECAANAGASYSGLLCDVVSDTVRPISLVATNQFSFDILREN